MVSAKKSFSRTKKKLLDAFWALYRDRGLENLTITEVALAAGCQRSTFYCHFDNLRDVLTAIEDRLLEGLDPKFMIMLSNPDTHDDEAAIRFYEDYFERYGEYFKVLLGQRGDPAFAARFMDLCSGHGLSEVALRDYEQAGDPVIDQALRVYTFAGAMAVLTYWVEHRSEMTVRQMRELLRYFAGGGKRQN